MKKLEVTVDSPEELDSVAGKLIEFAGQRTIWCFFGDLGAGKTTFIRAICAQLGVVTNVTSPTFSIVNEYVCADGDTIFHFDFYRIESIAEAVEIGCSEYFDSGHYCFIEWPEKILNLLPERYVRIGIEDQLGKRIFSFSYE